MIDYSDRGIKLEQLRVLCEELGMAVISKQKVNSEELELKVSQKGHVSVYGIGSFPITLKFRQWEQLLTNSEKILRFIDDNIELLDSSED